MKDSVIVLMLGSSCKQEAASELQSCCIYGRRCKLNAVGVVHEISQRSAILPTRVLKEPAATAVSTMLAIWRLDCSKIGKEIASEGGEMVLKVAGV